MGLTVTITPPGGSPAVYDEAAGKDLGDFTSPAGFVQGCLRVDVPGSPLTVFVRRDKGAARVEVVFELGRCWGTANQAAANLGPYSAVIAQDGATLATVGVPAHYWFSRWRWQSAPRKVFRTAEQVRKLAGLPRLDAALVNSEPGPQTYKGPMDNAGVLEGMPTTGDRPDIGIVTEWQAAWLATGDPAMQATVLAQAEASGSVPYHMRDELTGAPVNFDDDPAVQWISPTYSPKTVYVRTAPTPWTIDAAHMPALAFLPWLMTGDPYHLEELQFSLSWVLGWNIYYRQRFALPTCIPYSQIRATAWAIRGMAELAAETPDAVPSWLLPRPYWRQASQDNAAWYVKKWVNDPSFQVMRNGPGEIASWMDDYLITALCHACELGCPEWLPVLNWKAGSRVALADGQSGWNGQAAVPYYYYAQPPATPLRTPTPPPYRTWEDAWNDFVALSKAGYSNLLPAAATVQAGPPAWPLPWLASYGYFWWALGTAAWLVRLGVPGADPAYANLLALVHAAVATESFARRYSFAFAPVPG